MLCNLPGAVCIAVCGDVAVLVPQVVAVGLLLGCVPGAIMIGVELAKSRIGDPTRTQHQGAYGASGALRYALIGALASLAGGVAGTGLVFFLSAEQLLVILLLGGAYFAIIYSAFLLVSRLRARRSS